MMMTPDRRQGPSEIVPGLFIGALEDAATFDGRVICVMNRWPEEGHPDALWIPVVTIPGHHGELIDLTPEVQARIVALPENLMAVARVLDLMRGDERPVLVHCREGRERSPLAVAWYLRWLGGESWNGAYALLQSKRPQVEDRRQWLPEDLRR